MSDVNEKEAKWQDRLARSYKDYVITVACCIVGWFIFKWGNYSAKGDFGVGGNFPLTMLGYIIVGAPVFVKMLFSKSISALFFWKDYEVVTTYSDGTKK
jgi:uncharacterized protein Usg